PQPSTQPTPHPSLHSFPTRRSSDLAHRGRKHKVKEHADEIHAEELSGPLRKPERPGEPAPAHAAGELSNEKNAHGEQPVPVRDRSEEHTSELQSRGHLVCRLLLEKK